MRNFSEAKTCGAEVFQGPGRILATIPVAFGSLLQMGKGVDRAMRSGRTKEQVPAGPGESFYG